jgi:hypothetical protein
MVAGALQTATHDPAAALPHLDYVPVAVHGKGGAYLRVIAVAELSAREPGGGDDGLRRFIDSPPCRAELRALAREHALRAGGSGRHSVPGGSPGSSGLAGSRPPLARPGKASR